MSFVCLWILGFCQKISSYLGDTKRSVIRGSSLLFSLKFRAHGGQIPTISNFRMLLGVILGEHVGAAQLVLGKVCPRARARCVHVRPRYGGVHGLTTHFFPQKSFQEAPGTSFFGAEQFF